MKKKKLHSAYIGVAPSITLIKLFWRVWHAAMLVEVTHSTSGKKAGEQKLPSCKGMTSVKQNNDTALKSTCSHTVIGEGLIQSLQ